MEITGDLKVNALSGNALTQIDTVILNNCQSKSQFDTAKSNYYTKTQTGGLLVPITADTTNLKRATYKSNNWTSGPVVKYPQRGAFGLINILTR